ncbi:uncharacterized protein NPIL_649091, partial [Nephila pilipes]
MGRISLLKAGLITAVPILLAVITPSVQAAPVQETALSRAGNEKGCFYMNEQYPSGERIQTNEPCLNCTCIGNTLMCYLRVCPFVKPMGEKCLQEMHVGDCCPKFWCPEVYPYATTEKPDTEPRGCYLDGRYYDEGARIPMDPLKPCEVCYCIRNTSVCTVQECELKIDGCFPQHKAGSCCPSRYNCTEEAATTIPPGIMEHEDYEGCSVNGVKYKDGELVPSASNCETCYCMKHEVVCAVQECKAPANNCIPGEIEKGQCCPTKYECPPGTDLPDYSTTYASVEDLAKTDHEPATSETTTVHPGIEQDEEISSPYTTTIPPKMKAEVTDKIGETTESSAETFTSSLQTEVSELVTLTLPVENATFITGDLVSRPREPKITEVPEDMFSSVAAAKSTAKPVFYPSRPIPGEGICRHENKTYQSKESVPSSDPCRLNCVCLNSVVQCDLVECVLTPPEFGKNCKVKKLAEECCPKYVCDTPDELNATSEEMITSTITMKDKQHEVTDEFEAEQKTTPFFFETSTEHKELPHDTEEITELPLGLSTLTDRLTSVEANTSSEITTESSISTEREDQTISTFAATSISESTESKYTKVTSDTSSTKLSTSEIASTTTSPTEEITVEDFVPKSSTPSSLETSSSKSTSIFEESSTFSTSNEDEKLKVATTVGITTETKHIDTDKDISSEETTETDAEQTKELPTTPIKEFELTSVTEKSVSSTSTDFTKTTSHLSDEISKTEQTESSVLFSETTLADVEFKEHEVTPSTILKTSVSETLSTAEDISKVGSTITLTQKETQTISPEIKISKGTTQTPHQLATDITAFQKTTATLSEEIKEETSTPIYIITEKEESSSELPDKHDSTTEVRTTSTPIIEESETKLAERPMITTPIESEITLINTTHADFTDKLSSKFTTTVPSKDTTFIVDINKTETTTATLTSEELETKQPIIATMSTTLFAEDVSEKEFFTTSEPKLHTISKTETTVTGGITEVEKITETEVTELPNISSESTETELLVTEQQTSHAFDEELSPESLKTDAKVSTTEKPKIPEFITTVKTPYEESVDVFSQSTQKAETMESQTTHKLTETQEMHEITSVTSEKVITSEFEKTTEGYSTESKTDIEKETASVTESSKTFATEKTQSFDAESVTASSETSDLSKMSEKPTIPSEKSSVSEISTTGIPELTTSKTKETFTSSIEPTFETEEKKESTTPAREEFSEITKVPAEAEEHTDTASP